MQPVVTLQFDTASWSEVRQMIDALGCEILCTEEDDDWITVQVTAMSTDAIRKLVGQFGDLAGHPEAYRS